MGAYKLDGGPPLVPRNVLAQARVLQGLVIFLAAIGGIRNGCWQPSLVDCSAVVDLFAMPSVLNRSAVLMTRSRWPYGFRRSLPSHPVLSRDLIWGIPGLNTVVGYWF